MLDAIIIKRQSVVLDVENVIDAGRQFLVDAYKPGTLCAAAPIIFIWLFPVGLRKTYPSDRAPNNCGCRSGASYRRPVAMRHVGIRRRCGEGNKICPQRIPSAI